MYRLILLIVFTFSVGYTHAQENYWSIKGVGTANFQKWNNYERDVLFTPGIDIEFESYDNESSNSFYAQLGYHQRGSTLRGYGINTYQSYIFNNAVVEIGVKQGLTNHDESFSTYYLLAVRGEYTFDNNLDTEDAHSIYSLVDEEFVRNFPYGVAVGVGGRYGFTDGRSLILEFVVNPDIGKQYHQPYELLYQDPITFQNRVLKPQEVRNISIELKLGYRFFN